MPEILIALSAVCKTLLAYFEKSPMEAVE